MIGVLTGVLPDTVPCTEGVGIDWVVALVTILPALGTRLLFGVLAALKASSTDALAALKQGETAGARAGCARSGGPRSSSPKWR